MSKKIKLLFVSKHIVHDKVAMAGNQLFNYYLNEFCNDNRFEVGFIVAHKNDNSYEKMVDKYGSRTSNFSVYVPKFFRLFTYVYYNTSLRILFSLIHSDWYYLDPIYAFFYKKALKRVKNEQWIPDVVICEWTEMIFLKRTISRSFPKAITVATEHDVTYLKLFRRYGENALLKRRLVDSFKKRELFLLNSFDMVLVLSSDDQNRLISDGIDPSKITLLAPYYCRTNKSQGELKPQIVYYGAMNRIENQEAVEWFADHVFMKSKLSDSVKLLIVGGGNNERLIKKYKHFECIVFTGFVNDPSVYFNTALCMVVPLTNGGGIKIKVLEAMSSSVAVLTNEIGIEGLNAIKNKEYLYCETPEDYIKIINELLAAPDKAKAIGENGRLLVNKGFNFEESSRQYKERLVDLSERLKIN